MKLLLSVRTLISCITFCLLFFIGISWELEVTTSDDFQSETDISENGAVVKYSYNNSKYTIINNSSCNEDGKCTCGYYPCIRKCCPVGMFLSNKTCMPTEMPFLIPEKRKPYLNTFGIVHGYGCHPKVRRLLLDPRDNITEDEFILLDDGRLYVPYGENYYSISSYCVDYIEEEDEVLALICSLDENEVPREYYSMGMIISMPFLLLTFIVYALLPERNMHGKSLMCYVISLFGAYFLLVFIQLSRNFAVGTCRTLGLLCLFFFMVSFFWMNVMSIDIWWAFSGLRGFSGSKKEAERKRFLLYSGYAWGMPLLHVILVICLTLGITSHNLEWYNPGMGDGQCWFRSGVPTLVYFYGPMAVLVIVNITLFVVTACKIKQVQQDTAMLRKDESKKHSYENDKQRFNLYLKLMLAMGVNWSMEIVSWAVNWQVGHVPPAVWYITDFCNALYGVFIFFIFVFKKNIWKLLKRRYYLVMGKPHLARSMTQTVSSPRTTGTSFNHTISTDTKGYANDSSVLTSEVA
ncbi:hypothetical protein ILUMI_21141 [Ignelater luminosus]|uniref:G-protein coupled receptors family 2 profile 2 domain-containing protein n=1 Tax=Ignelater luminosus TaxID=2038154 RepID=A0A8K0CJF7_IGNLU|nr:hypothetical protein ILUMI_21141 [Ignelater luminosus]